MIDAADPDLVAYLASSTGLPEPTCRRLVLDVLSRYDETVETYVTRRHGELKADGLKNEQIYQQLQCELGSRRFAAATLTERQIRRMIYG